MKFNADMPPATIKGWLYKRGNDGLKLWKKRYFVLSEYCLSYYKSAHDDKTSGSILLPSYRISPVSKEDGIPRKFAFKAEHHNMRTYYFAADSQTNMIQWMNALSLASILQSEKSFVRPKNKKILNNQHHQQNNNTQEYRYSQQYELTNGSSPNFHNYPPAVHTMHGSSGNAYVKHPNNNNNTTNNGVQACAPAPVYVNAPPKPRRTTSVPVNPVMVTGQYQQPLNEVQHAHQRYLPTPTVNYEAPQHEHFAPQLSPNYANNTNSSRVADFSRSLGRSSGAEFLRHNQHQHQHQQFQQNNSNNNNYNYFGSMGRSSGAMMAPRTPMMGRQIKARRYSQLPPRPKSSIDQRNEAFFNQDWPSRPVESNEVSAPRDPRLFPIMRTPQVPRKTTTTTLNQDQEVSQYFERTSSARMKSRTPNPVVDPLDPGNNKQPPRDESMKRLNEWKQRMLQSPLTRKSSRAQTPVSPKLVHHSKVTRKGSNASKTSRTRSLSRLSNRLSSTSSSDEESPKNARETARHQRRKVPTKKDADPMKTKMSDNVFNLSAQDLLSKSHEELVLLLIHLRRQMATLSEAIDGSRSELENITNTIVTSSDDKDSLDNKRILDDLHLQVKELEEKRAKIQPIINLVDNMVKLGSLYRGPSDAPLSHRIRNLPSASSNANVNSKSNTSTTPNPVPQELKDEIQQKLEDLFQIDMSLSLEAVNVKHLIQECQVCHELILRAKVVRKDIGHDAERIPEHQTFLEADLQKAQTKLKQTEMKLEEIAFQQSRWEQEMLLLRQQLQASATRDMKFGIHQSVETLHIEAELATVQQKAAKLTSKRTDLLAELQKCTSTSKSQYGEMLEVSSSNGSVNDKQKQSSQIPKTVRMVKRDSKDRLRDGGSGAFNGKSWNEENTSIISPPPPPPPTLPRGNSQNVHNFLKNDDPPVDDALHNDVMEQASEKFAEKQSISQLSKASTLPRSFRAVEDLKDLRNNQHNIHGNGNGGPVYSGLVKPSMIHGGAGTKYNIGYRKKLDERPSSALSAHERLFGSSREASSSPPESPSGKKGSSISSTSGDSSLSPIMSPIFKSDTARAIAKEVGLVDNNHHLNKNTKAKKRSLTITSSNPASVIEALNNHQAKEMGGGRSCDDLDLEQALKQTDGLTTPDVIKSALDHKSEGSKISETTIDSLFGVPEKIDIPERYIPDTDMDNLTPEEKQVRLKKADSIRRMLAEQSSVQSGHRNTDEGTMPDNLQKQAMDEEKKQREHLLALNQVIARQVMEKSRMVAGRHHHKPR